MISANTITAAYGRAHKGNPHKSPRASRLRLSEKSRKHTSGACISPWKIPGNISKVLLILLPRWTERDVCSSSVDGDVVILFLFSSEICNTAGIYFRKERFLVCNEGRSTEACSDESLKRTFFFKTDLLFYLNVVRGADRLLFRWIQKKLENL